MISVEEDAFKEQSLLAQREFRLHYEPKMRQAIKEFAQTARPEWAKARRREYLQARVEGLERKLYWLRELYVLAFRGGAIAWSKVLLDQANALLKELRHDRWRLTQMDRPEKSGVISDEMIAAAKQFPFDRLVEFKRDFALCPFHSERVGSLHLYRTANLVHCFGSCRRTWDPVGFLMEKDGLSFRQAVESLQ